MNEPKRNIRRRDNYTKLRGAGFSALISTKFRDTNRRDVEMMASLKIQNDGVLVNQIYALTGVRVDAKDL